MHRVSRHGGSVARGVAATQPGHFAFSCGVSPFSAFASPLCLAGTPNGNGRILQSVERGSSKSKGGLAAAVSAATAAALLCVAGTAVNAEPQHETDLHTTEASDEEYLPGKIRDDLPVFTAEEVAKHNAQETGIWVVFRHGVYDITRFVAQHPGGSSKVRTVHRNRLVFSLSHFFRLLCCTLFHE